MPTPCFTHPGPIDTHPGPIGFGVIAGQRPVFWAPCSYTYRKRTCSSREADRRVLSGPTFRVADRGLPIRNVQPHRTRDRSQRCAGRRGTPAAVLRCPCRSSTPGPILCTPSLPDDAIPEAFVSSAPRVRLRVRIAAAILLAMVSVAGCADDTTARVEQSPPITTSSAIPSSPPGASGVLTANPTTPSTGLAHCPGKITINVREITTSPMPGQLADGWGFAGGDRVRCLGRRDCWIKVEVPDPGLYPAGREHWLPVSATKLEDAFPGGACFNAQHYLDD